MNLSLTGAHPVGDSYTMKSAFTINEASTEIGVGRTKLYREISEGNIEARKLGKRTLILGDELRRYLNSLPVAA